MLWRAISIGKLPSAAEHIPAHSFSKTKQYLIEAQLPSVNVLFAFITIMLDNDQNYCNHAICWYAKKSFTGCLSDFAFGPLNYQRTCSYVSAKSILCTSYTTRLPCSITHRTKTSTYISYYIYNNVTPCIIDAAFGLCHLSHVCLGLNTGKPSVI